jgi:hypothetical protein
VLESCALDPYNLTDPETILGVEVKSTDVMKSIRCEIVTFLVENRLRSAIWNEEVGSIDQIHPPPDIQDRVDVVRNYPFIPMD